MDINLIRILVTLAAFGAFLGIVWWAYTPARKSRFDEDSHLVFDEFEPPAPPGSGR